METYRSGHNENDSKSFCLHGHVGSNPTVSALFPETNCFRDFIMDFSLLTTSGVSQKRNEAVGNTKPPAMRVEDKLLYKKITFPL